jgi:flagellar protein FliO/FliZ
VFEELLGETGGTIAQFALSLVVVVALIFLVAWVVKRFGGSRFGAHHGGEAELQVVDTLSIDPKRKLVLVRHGKLEHLLLIGGGSDEVIERSMVGGIPLSARMQASKAHEKQDEESQARPADRFRTSNRFTSALLRRKAGEEASERPLSGSTAPGTATEAAAGVVAGAVGAAATTAQAEAETKASDAGPTVPSAAASPSLSRPSEPTSATRPSADLQSVPQDEREALDRSLDEALSASLLDESAGAKLDAKGPAPAPELPATKHGPKPSDPLAPLAPAPSVAAPPVAPSVPTDADAPAAPAASLDDLDLERELEAALQLDSFEVAPEGSQPAPESDLPPLPDLPDLPDLSMLTDNGEAQNDATPASLSVRADEDAGNTSQETKDAAASKDPKPAAALAKPEPPEPVDPLKLSSLRQTDPSPQTAPESARRPAPDIPVALSGRDDPPIPVTIPSRGPAANATTLAKADDAEKIDKASNAADDHQALDISLMLQPAGTLKEDSSSKEEKPADLDDEMRRLLGEIAGGSDTK